MGELVDGVWTTDQQDKRYRSGRFHRSETQFRDAISAEPGSRFQPEAGRYHLYISLACPWAHRTLIYRHLARLDPLISLSVVDPFMGEMGWQFSTGPGCIGDSVNQTDYIHQVYQAADPNYTGRASVPVLWDKHEATIVNNESAEIIRMLDHAFEALTGADLDFYPKPLAEEIDALNAEIYANVNNGVYRCGFAREQGAYEQAFEDSFATLDGLEQRLGRNRYLLGDRITEADWRLFPTLVRFDPVYHGHFKCNRQRLREFSNLWNYTCDLYQQPGIAETVDLVHIKRHYYESHLTVNPTGIVPKGPAIDYSAPHGRNALG